MIQPHRFACVSTVRSAIIGTLALLLFAGVGCTSSREVDDAAMASTTDRLRGADAYARGADAYRSGDKQQALVLLNQAVTENPNLRMAQAMVADLYRERKDYKNAAIHYEAAARLDPYSINTLYSWGLMEQYIAQLRKAAAAYLRVLEIQPNDLKSNMNLGTVYIALGETSDAIDSLTKATKIDPKSADAWSNLGVAYDASGNRAEAEKSYRRSLELNPTPATLQNLGANLISQKRAPEAVNILKQASQRSTAPGVLKAYADALSETKQYDAAIAQYDAILKTSPRYTPAINGKASTLYRQYKDGFELDDTKLAAAVELWKQSVAIDPNQPGVARAISSASGSGMIKSK